MKNKNISEAHVISDEGDFGPHLIIDIKLNNGGRVILDNVNWNLSGKNIAVWCIGNYSIDGTYYKKSFFNKIADRASYESLRCDVLSDSLDIKLETAFDVVNNYSMILDYIESRKRENNLKNKKSLFLSTKKYDSWIYLDYFPNSHINSLYENWNRWH